MNKIARIGAIALGVLGVLYFGVLILEDLEEFL